MKMNWWLLVIVIENGGRVFLDALPKEVGDPETVKALLSKRPELAKIKKRIKDREARLTVAGTAKTQCCGDVTSHGSRLEKFTYSRRARIRRWRELEVGRSTHARRADVYPAKIHPLRKIIEQTRRAFLEMGFAEVVSPMVESAFWNFDALFQPQDHPAREMQDRSTCCIRPRPAARCENRRTGAADT